MAKIVDLDESRYLVVKGAPDSLMDIILNSNSEFNQIYWKKENDMVGKTRQTCCNSCL